MPKPTAASPSTCVALIRAAAVNASILTLLEVARCGLQAEDASPALPSFADLEAAGARIGEIRVVVNDVFDTSDPKESKWPFRLANALHIQTRPGVIRRALLFKSGEPFTVQKLEETERFLRGQHYLYDVDFRVLAYHDGVVDLEVTTRDTWTLDPGVSVGRSGGANSSSVYLEEYNLLGTGIKAGFNRSKNVDRSSTEFFLSNNQLLGSRAALNFSRQRNSDGHKEALSLIRPFYALDTRWSAGVSASNDTHIDSIYTAGVIDRQYRHEVRNAEGFGAWSAGLVDGWVQRYALGLKVKEDRYPNESGLVTLDQQEKIAGPFVRYELLEDRYAKLNNRNLVGRPEFFALGLASTVQLERSEPGLGSNRAGWLYSGQVSRGFELPGRQTIVASISVEGSHLGGQLQAQTLGTQLNYYLPQSLRWLFYTSAAYDRISHAGRSNDLLLGGDNGLRGYPLRYQSGRQRALFTLEERCYADWFIWRLFRIGGAVFLDTGRAWGGATVNMANPGWLSDAGMGLRIVSARSAFGNVLHLDLAYALNPAPGIKRVQFLVKSKTTF